MKSKRVLFIVGVIALATSPVLASAVAVAVTPTPAGSASSASDTVTVNTNNTTGYNLKLSDSDTTLTLAGPSATTLAGTWSGLVSSASPSTVKTTAAVATNDATTVWYGVQADSTKPNGVYTDSVTYTATTNP